MNRRTFLGGVAATAALALRGRPRTKQLTDGSFVGVDRRDAPRRIVGIRERRHEALWDTIVRTTKPSSFSGIVSGRKYRHHR